jgi:hypothetical protein
MKGMKTAPKASSTLRRWDRTHGTLGIFAMLQHASIPKARTQGTFGKRLRRAPRAASIPMARKRMTKGHVY